MEMRRTVKWIKKYTELLVDINKEKTPNTYKTIIRFLENYPKFKIVRKNNLVTLIALDSSQNADDYSEN